ncbi:MAG: Glutamate synthase [NADPH] large chain [Rhodanobacteraceae bacterium]|jgi:hypothetical protein|nr:MAG: Glutamate synthase [NADPH] large chain [Rhodanobacteraceae bacterium]
MSAAPALRELQRDFLAALYAGDTPGLLDAIAGHGLAPAARLQVYRHNVETVQRGALETAFPAVRALVGEAFFAQSAERYRQAHPSRSGNLQAFGAHFAAFLEALPETRSLPYLGDVARLEWLRQQSALAADAEALDVGAFAHALASMQGALRIALHPSLRLLASRQPVLSIWRYALNPTEDSFTPPEAGERVLLWRSGDEVTMSALDAASFTCIGALAQDGTLDDAHAAALSRDPDFDLPGCMTSLVDNGLVTALTEVEPPAAPGRDTGPTRPCCSN